MTMPEEAVATMRDGIERAKAEEDRIVAELDTEMRERGA